ncbi:hypothetical protein [Methylobacterium sp. WL9]|uniref:hypothetical protein n=1 Tax=Methylobacterium sp. WL9 TaxID=2603898 RepID=UPI0011C76B18|nr:hypothetical protein [Methylobacterium sp. WL9]TXN22157.1 hypothetical protein FV217_11835 [Methylobacterium sp. WL9]
MDVLDEAGNQSLTAVAQSLGAIMRITIRLPLQFDRFRISGALKLQISQFQTNRYGIENRSIALYQACNSPSAAT